MKFSMAIAVLLSLILISLLYTYNGSISSFRGGEAIGGRTGGSAYSGAGADLVD